MQKNGIDVYDLQSLKFKKTIAVRNKIPSSASCDGVNYFVIFNGEILKIDDDGKTETIAFTTQKESVFPTLFSENNRLIAKVLSTKAPEILQFNSNLKQYKKTKLSIEGNLNGLKFIDGKYWVLSSKGLYLFDSLFSSNATLYFKGKNISNCIKDRQGNFWITTTNEGMFLISNMQNKSFDWSNYFPTQIEKINDKILLSNTKGAIFQFDKYLNFEKKIYEHPSKEEIYYLDYDSNYNDLYFSSLGFTYVPKMQFQTSIQHEFATKKIERIDAKYAFIGTSTTFGIIQFSDIGKSSWNLVYEKSIANSNGKFNVIQSGVRVRTLAYLKQAEKVFCANSLGFFSFDKTNGLQEINYNKKPFFVKNLYEYNEKVYVLTAESELFTIDKNNQLTNISNLFSDLEISIQKIKGFNEKLVIIGTEKIAIFDCKSNQVTPVNVPVFTKNIRDIVLINNELLLLSNNKILKITDFSNVKKESAVFQIANFLINGKSSKINQKNDLKSGQYNLQIDFSVLDFGTINDNQLYYRINQNNWIPLDEKAPELQLVLNEGFYEIEFKLNNQIQKDKIIINIDVPFWKRIEYIILFSLLIGVLIFAYYQIQFKKIKKKNTILVERNKLLEEKITLEKNLKKSILATVKSQMNPHFFYNALNTIQAYIFNNDKTKASNYLSKFSKLTRLILEMSEQETVLLKDEIQALKLYLDLEKMRFQEEFEYQIFYTEEMLFAVELPSMLLQPYVENAVKHGLLHKKDGVGKINIHFEIIEKDLVVKIIDNGIGIKRSAEINKIRQDKSKSFATQANKKRLDILNDGRTDKISIAFAELNNQSQRVTGTEVKIIIPLEYDI